MINRNKKVFIDMKTKEFDNIITGILEEETRKLLQEQINNEDSLIDSVKNFQTLSGLVEKITSIKGANNTIVIGIDGVTPEELVQCCGGDSLGKAQTNLMQGLLHDLDDNGFSGNYDVDINTQGDEGGLSLTIQISPNDDDLSNETEMSEVEDNGELTNTFGQALYEKGAKVTNPTADDKKDLILGDEKEIDESDEKWIQKAFNKIDKKGTEGKCTGDKFGGPGCPEGSKQYNMAKTLRKMNESTKKTITLDKGEMADLLSNIIKEAAQDNITEHHKKDKASQISFICKNDDTCKKEDLEKLSDEEVEKKYLALEKKMGLKEQVESPNITIPANGIPGIDVTKKVTKDAGKENDAALKAVEKKIKDYLDFEGNDDPESPNQIGGDKVSVTASDSQEEEIELNRGRNPADLTYDSEPGKTFREREKLSLVGAAEMGNSHEYANVVNPDSKVGENVAKVAEKRRQAREDEPIYDKEALPVKEDPKKPNRPAVDDPSIAGDIHRMKQITGYKENTQ